LPLLTIYTHMTISLSIQIRLQCFNMKFQAVAEIRRKVQDTRGREATFLAHPVPTFMAHSVQRAATFLVNPVQMAATILVHRVWRATTFMVHLCKRGLPFGAPCTMAATFLAHSVSIFMAHPVRRAATFLVHPVQWRLPFWRTMYLSLWRTLYGGQLPFWCTVCGGRLPSWRTLCKGRLPY